MKIFVITHNLVADSGHVITVVQADTEAQALEKYKKTLPSSILALLVDMSLPFNRPMDFLKLTMP